MGARKAAAAAAAASSSKGSSRRIAWLEAEYARLGFECQYLDAVNKSLNRKLDGIDDDGVELPDESDEEEEEGNNGPLSPDQIEIQTEPSLTKKRSLGPRKGTGDLSDVGGPKLTRRPSVKYKPEDETGGEPDDLSRFESQGSLSGGLERVRSMMTRMGTYTNAAVMRGSALGKSKPVQAVIYLTAFAGVIFVLVATATHLGAAHHDDSHGDAGHEDADAAHADAAHGDTAAAGADSHSAGGHRRLGGAAPALLKNIAFSLVSSGLFGYFAHILKQPLIIGYLLGGVFVGPIGLNIVAEYAEIDEISELGLLFLLFMIGMELDFHKLFKMDRVCLMTGCFQFPLCAGILYFILSWLNEISGLQMGTGDHPMVYISLTCSVSSTMVVTKILSEKFETDSPAGKLTNGILMCQDIWAVVVLAIQPTVAKPDAGQILKNFLMIAVLVAISLCYAKFVMPPVLLTAAKSVELMLVLALSWCFFICSVAVLPFVGLSMELAAIIAGCALATFPYSQDFNGKIKYIRDFFITLFFAGVGMQVPVPNGPVILKALLVAVLVLMIRWVGIFALVVALGGEPRIGAVSTINLSQIGEFAIVICSMGIFEGGGFGHIGKETMTVIIWTFAIMAVTNCYAIHYNQVLVRGMVSLFKKVRPRAPSDNLDDEDFFDVLEDERDIVFLGFHKVAALLIAEFQIRSPQILKRIHVIDINPAAMSSLREKGIKCSSGDFASSKELSRVHKGTCTLAISSIPDSLLQGVSNMKLLKVVRDIWPDAHFVGTADNPYQAQSLYEAGADYVVRMAKLCAERLHHLLSEHCSTGSGELTELFEKYKGIDKDAKTKRGFLSPQI